MSPRKDNEMRHGFTFSLKSHAFKATPIPHRFSAACRRMSVGLTHIYTCIQAVFFFQTVLHLTPYLRFHQHILYTIIHSSAADLITLVWPVSRVFGPRGRPIVWVILATDLVYMWTNPLVLRGYWLPFCSWNRSPLKEVMCAWSMACRRGSQCRVYFTQRYTHTHAWLK